MCAIF
jgi:glyceraldehyde 3-phosphate dehydrogenase